MAQGGEQGTLTMGIWLGGLRKKEWKEQEELLRQKFGNNLGDPLEQKGLGIGVGVCWRSERFEFSRKRGGSPGAEAVSG